MFCKARKNIVWRPDTFIDNALNRVLKILPVTAFLLLCQNTSRKLAAADVNGAHRLFISRSLTLRSDDRRD